MLLEQHQLKNSVSSSQLRHCPRSHHPLLRAPSSSGHCGCLTHCADNESKQDFWFILLYRLGSWGLGTWPDRPRMLASEGDAPSNHTPCVLPVTSPVRLLVISDHRLWKEVEKLPVDISLIKIWFNLSLESKSACFRIHPLFYIYSSERQRENGQKEKKKKFWGKIVQNS